MADPTLNPWSPVAASLLTATKATLETSAKGFLASHTEAEQFIVQCTERLAKAMFLYAIESDPDKKADLGAQIDALKDAVKEESMSVIVDFEKAAPSVFMAILETIFNVGKTFAPLLLKAAL